MVLLPLKTPAPRARARRDAVTGAAALGLGLVLLAVLVVVKVLPGLNGGAPRRLTVLFPTAEGLREGDDVRASGIFVGRVAKLALEPDGAAATLAFHRALDLREDAEFRISDRSVLGGYVVDVRPGKGAPARGDVFRGAMPATLSGIITEFMNSMAPKDGAPGFVENLRELAKALEQRVGILGELAHGTLRSDLEALAAAPAADGESLARMLGTDSAVKDGLDAIAREVRALRDKDSLASALLALAGSGDDPIVRDVAEIEAAVAAAREAMAEGRGSAALLNEEDAFWRQVGELRDMFAALGEEGEGAVGWLIGPEGRAALDSISASIRDLKYLLSRGAGAGLGGSGIGGVFFDMIAFLAGDDRDRQEQSLFTSALRLSSYFFFPNTGLSIW
ncbi:MAG TPA: MCE family protein [Planctomycetota bacterium]|nr:MCE family protein [Planctomycetota bacterium]HNS00467.1 MCE family protein [Planctomycetota bacterium]HNU25304.1 MCE family protein [Planctomycetota bacterium]HOE31407.1 MCE family protein [Planctomycetota bacterium]HOE87465.1 MCE family protein [Planctomycetota bacterium]